MQRRNSVFVLSVVALGIGCTRTSEEYRLAERVKGKVHQELPDADVKIVDARELHITAGDLELTMYLDNLAIKCDAAPEDCDDNIRIHVDSLVSGVKNAAAGTKEEADPAMLMVTIKHRDYLKQVEEMTRNSPKPAENALVAKQLAGDLWMVLVLDSPTSMAMVTQSKLTELGIDRDAAFARAVKNLEKLDTLADEELEGLPIHAIGSDDSYASARLLLTERWKKRAATVDGDLILAAPTRDVLFYTSSKEPKAMVAMAEAASRMAGENAYGLSGQLLRWTGSGWVVHDGGGAAPTK